MQESTNRRSFLGTGSAGLAAGAIASVADVRASSLLVRSSPELAEKKLGLERFLFDRVYRHPEILDRRRQAQQALRETFRYLVGEPDQLPAKFRRLAEKSGLDPNVWFHNVELGAAKIVGQETVRYVANIYKYYVAYKLATERQAERAAERDRAKATLDDVPQ